MARFTCVECETEYEAGRGQHKYCSDDCRNSANSRNIKIRRHGSSERFIKYCVICGGEIPSNKKINSSTCSTKCERKNAQRTYNKKHGRLVELRRQEKRKENPERVLINQVRGRARRSGISFDITESDISIPDVCPVLGIPLITSNINGEGQREYRNYASIDRKDPQVGYVKGNVQVISARANRIKYNATSDELRKVLAYVEECERCAK